MPGLIFLQDSCWLSVSHQWFGAMQNASIKQVQWVKSYISRFFFQVAPKTIKKKVNPTCLDPYKVLTRNSTRPNSHHSLWSRQSHGESFQACLFLLASGFLWYDVLKSRCVSSRKCYCVSGTVDAWRRISQSIYTWFCCALFCCGYVINYEYSCDGFTHILQGCFTGTGAVVWLTHWPPGDFNEILNNFQANFSDRWLRYFLWNCPQVILIGPYWWQVNIGLGNGLVLSCNKPLPEPMLTQIYVAIWRHQATMS